MRPNNSEFGNMPWIQGQSKAKKYSVIRDKEGGDRKRAIEKIQEQRESDKDNAEVWDA